MNSHAPGMPRSQRAGPRDGRYFATNQPSSAWYAPMMAASPSIRNSASGTGAWPMICRAMYSQ
jgi:hypothetical protein